ncbi:MAG: hypothetical protein IT230_05230 [Flavobacteriales bacterium]|nr:hypothetical protein [Flavobacteriales bacterium]
MRSLHFGLALLAPALFLAACGAVDGRGRTPDADTAAAPAPQQSAPVVDGLAQEFDLQGHLQMEGNMRAGKRHGLWTSYFPNGRVRSRSEYVAGRLEGVATVFRETGGMYYTGQYSNDRQVGEWRFFDDLGNLARTVRYDTTGAIINDPGTAP